MKKLLVMGALLVAIVMPAGAADFNGDGIGDIAIFRPSSGLWSVREITRTYFGGTGDSPVPGDYDGSGTDSVAIFRSSSGLWAVSGVTRAYFGGASDEAKPGDYNGDRVCDIGIFRAGSGLWAVRGITRVYYGSTGDSAIAAGTVKSPTRAIDDSTTAQVAGYYNAFDLMVESPDLATANIKSGATIFGIMGDSNVVDTSSGDATAGDILASKKAYVDGSEVTGTIATQTLSSSSEVVNVGFFAQTTLSGVDSDLVTENIKKNTTIFGIKGDSYVVDTSSGNAGSADILLGRSAYVDGNEVTGTIVTRTLSSDNENMEAGYYNATTLSKVDSDLATGNIKNGVAIFGISGTYTDIGVPKTGQVTSYMNYDDGYYANPAGTDIGNPQGEGTWSGYTADGGRFTIQTSGLPGGVVLDNATGLSWATGTDGAGCNFGDQTDWASAVAWAANLNFANHYDWRLPNVDELSLIADKSKIDPAIDVRFFPGTIASYYWSSTTYVGNPDAAWQVSFYKGYVDGDLKTTVNYVRAVREGE
jgi:hypothetical protein